MLNCETANFHLNTTDIDTQNTGNINNSYGIINEFRNDITWYNINFKTILGDMFNKYDKFNIRLCSIMYSAALAPSTNASDLSLKINVNGLPFSNCTYHTISNSNTSRCIMGAFQLYPETNQLYFNDDNVFTVDKLQETTNIRIYLSRLSDVAPVWVSLGPQYDFYFRIYGVNN